MHTRFLHCVPFEVLAVHRPHFKLQDIWNFVLVLKDEYFMLVFLAMARLLLSFVSRFLFAKILELRWGHYSLTLCQTEDTRLVSFTTSMDHSTYHFTFDVFAVGHLRVIMIGCCCWIYATILFYSIVIDVNAVFFVELVSYLHNLVKRVLFAIVAFVHDSHFVSVNLQGEIFSIVLCFENNMSKAVVFVFSFV